VPRPICPIALVLIAILAGSRQAEAQTRAIVGRVVDSASGRVVAAAEVTVARSTITTRTNADGQFSIAAPTDSVTLVVRAIGFRRGEVAVPAETAAVDIRLMPDPFRLEEVVVTGQATGVERQNLPNAVATVSAEQLTRAPTPTLENALQGKIPGALIQANSGAPGGGIQINLRGVSTINAGVDPLIVVDGIVISNAAIPNGADAVTQAQAGGNPRNQDNPVNRIADLNPADIERIEVLKGGSAAAIYGSKATNGVLIITTKRGQTGKPQFNITQRLGTFSRSNTLGSRTFATLEEATAVFDPDPVVAAAFQPGRTFNFEDALYGRNALSSETSASVSGGTDQTKYFISGLVKNDEGIALNTGYRKQAVRANIDQQLGGGFQLGVSTNVIHSLAARGLSNNDNSGTSPFLVFPFTPNFIDLNAVGDSFPLNPFERSNPLQTFALLRNDEDVWRALGTLTLRWLAASSERHNLQFITIGGADYFNQQNDFVSPPELEFEPNDGQPGTVVLGKSSNLNLNLAVNGNYTYSPSSRTQATTSLGVQYEDRDLNATRILGRTLLTGQANPDQATSVTVLQDVQPVQDLGVYGQEEVLLMDRRLLLTAGLRADRSSSNGNTNKFFFYPKAAVSYRLTTLFGGSSEVKLRGAFGQTGNQPLFGAKFTPDTTSTIGGLFGTFVGSRAGDPNIQPERQTEFEAGFDAALFDGRAELNFSVYQRTITDLLLEQTLAPTTGQEFRIFSSDSRLRNRGVEVGFALTPVQTADLNWVFRTTFFSNRAKITRLDVPTFQTGGFALALGTYQIEEDSSATQIFGLVGTDALGNAIAGKVGDATPDFQMSFASDLDYKRLSLGFLFDWKQGGDIINLTEFLYDAGQNSRDFEAAGAARVARFGEGFSDVYVQDGTYLKLRELSLAYTLPESFTASLFGAGLRYARLSLSGRNLLRFTPYRGLDPEVSNFGNQAIVRNIDVAPFPPSRSFFFSIDLGF
jgi:TonB-linked SusC/RagA family outer membrane protein